MAAEDVRRLRRDLLWLKIYAGILSAAVVGLALAVLQPRQTLDELNVHRINVLEPSGTARLVISNSADFPIIKLGGKEYPRKKGLEPAGLVFYDSKGMEMGGLALTDNRETRVGALAFDSPNYDAIGLSTVVSPDGTEATSGLVINSHPPKELDPVEASQVVQRRVGIHNRNENAEVVLSDPQGRERLRLVVDDKGEPRLEMLDSEGRVTLRLSGKSKGEEASLK